MAVIKYDVSDVEPGGGGEQPPPDVYAATIAQVTDRRPDKNDLEVVVDLGPEWARVWSYVNFGEPSKWKFREFTDALGLKPKGSLDPDKLKGKKVNVKITADQYEGNYKGRVGRWMKPGSTEDGDTTEEPPDDQAQAEDAAAEGDGDGSGIDEGLLVDLHTDADDYSDWPDDDVKGYFDDLGLTMSGRKTRAKMIEAIVAFAVEREGGGSDGDGDGDAEAPTDEYDEWTVDDLKEEVKDRNDNANAEIKISGRPSKEKLIEALRADDAKEPF